jgi:proteic killer suppression protein
MIQSFGGEAPRDLFTGTDSRAARQRLPAIWNRVVRRRLDLLDAARSPKELASVPGNRLLERSIRVSDSYRVYFEWTDEGPAAVDVGRDPETDRGIVERPSTSRRPTHPGEVLLLDVMRPLRLTQTGLAPRFGISYPRIGPELWLDLQQAVDLWDARHPG